MEFVLPGGRISVDSEARGYDGLVVLQGMYEGKRRSEVFLLAPLAVAGIPDDGFIRRQGGFQDDGNDVICRRHDSFLVGERLGILPGKRSEY
jgi:hypothetical protein